MGFDYDYELVDLIDCNANFDYITKIKLFD